MFACLYSPSTPHEEIEQIARNFSPRIECPAASMVVLDISGLERLLGTPDTIASELIKACAGASVAIAGTRVAAQLLARCGEQVRLKPAPTSLTPGTTCTNVGSGVSRSRSATHIVMPGGEAAAIGTLPVAVLLHVGAPPDLLATLARWGLHTLQAFAALPSDALASRIGQQGLAWQRIARGEDSRPLVPVSIEERFERFVDLEWPVEGIEPLAFVLGGLLDSLCTRLEMRDRAVAVIELRLRLAVSRTWRLRRLELPAPMRDPRMLRTLLCLDLEGRPLEAGEADGVNEKNRREVIDRSIDRVGVFIEPTPGPVVQHSLLARPGLTSMSPEVIATLMARLHALMGQERCGRARLLDTHRPDAFVMDEFTSGIADPTFIPRHARDELSSSSLGVARNDREVLERSKVRPGASPSSRDVKIGRATRSSRALRRLRHPIPARVAVEHGRPVRVTTDRRGWSGGRIVWCAGPWRVSGDWWSMLYRRQEWDVSLADRASYRIHEDRLLRRWFIDAVID